jgi:hypothetical protein
MRRLPKRREFLIGEDVGGNGRAIGEDVARYRKWKSYSGRCRRKWIRNNYCCTG